MQKTTGTKKSVATVAKSSPPITARPSGAFCSPPRPGPAPSAHADNHGQRGHRHRAQPDATGVRARGDGVAVLASRSLAKSTTRMLLAVATAMPSPRPWSEAQPISKFSSRIIHVSLGLLRVFASSRETLSFETGLAPVFPFARYFLSIL